MPKLHHENVLSARNVALVKHPDCREGIDQMAGMLLEILRSEHIKTGEWHERKATDIEREMDRMANEDA